MSEYTEYTIPDPKQVIDPHLNRIIKKLSVVLKKDSSLYSDVNVLWSKEHSAILISQSSIFSISGFKIDWKEGFPLKNQSDKTKISINKILKNK